jgi:peptidoglycan/LPS O-acetylase OafA/YrhL
VQTDSQPIASIGALNTLRGLAVLAILVRHAWGLFGSPKAELFEIDFTPLVNQLSSAVDAFFVLSGAVLAISYTGTRNRSASGSLKRFYVSRLIRIAPAYWIVLAFVVVFLVPRFIPEEEVFSNRGVYNIVSYFMFTQQLDPLSHGKFAIVSPFWTLSIEMAFYLLVPFLVWLAHRIGLLGLISLGLGISIGWLLLVAYTGIIDDALMAYAHFFNVEISPDYAKLILSHQLPAYLGHFAIGTAIGVFWLSRKGMGRPAALVIQSLGFLVLFAWMYLLGAWSISFEFWDPFNYIALARMSQIVYFFGESIPYAVAFGAVILGSVYWAKRRKSIVLDSVLSFYGEIGYSLYLWHMPLLYLLVQSSLFAFISHQTFKWLLLWSATVGIITCCSWVYYRGVEKPFHALARKFK